MDLTTIKHTLVATVNLTMVCNSPANHLAVATAPMMLPLLEQPGILVVVVAAAHARNPLGLLLVASLGLVMLFSPLA